MLMRTRPANPAVLFSAGLTTVVMGLAFGLIGASSCLAEEPAPKPNIIFILADDLGYADLGCYGQRHFETPHLDRMAAEGMRFTQHYAGSTVCAPSRACLLAGKHTGHVTQRVNGSLQFPEDPVDVCVARLLKRVGYTTALIGKSGLSCNSADGGLPQRKGFDEFFGYTSHVRAHRYFPEWLWRNGEKVELPRNQEQSGVHYSGDLFMKETEEFLRANAEGPFFLHLALQQPHADLNVPGEWRERFLGRYDEVPFKGGHYRAEENPKATFAGMVAYLDNAVGRVLDQLRVLGIERDTLVIFSSDNGPMSEGGWDKRYFDSNGPLRGGKRDLYEGGVRVPTIAWQPGVVQEGSETDHVSAFWDFLPTACELAGAPIPDDTDGISYAPTLTGQGDQQEHDWLYWEFYERGGKQAVRYGNWKGVRLGMGANRKPLELYDLATDLGERNNVAAEHPEVVARLEQIMREANTPVGEYRMEE